jgi:UDP-N-acetyl-D-glucosamine dehydrogenase
VPIQDRVEGDGAVAEHDRQDAAVWSAAVVGLGYAGLPTALALHGRCPRIIGIDVSQQRLAIIGAGCADLAGPDRSVLEATLADHTLELTSDTGAVAAADAVIICVPARLDECHVPDLAALRGACDAVVAGARPGQTIILTSAACVGTTRELLAEPLAARGLRVGSDVFVAFSPEPGAPDDVGEQRREIPRVVGGVTRACGERAAKVAGKLTDQVYLLSTADAAEAATVQANVSRAVSLALANEFADACAVLGVDPVEVALAAGIAAPGFPGTFPGPGAGGHAVAAAPHYLLWQLGRLGQQLPLIEQTVRSIALRPAQVVDRACEMLTAAGAGLAGAKVVVVGAAYQAGVADVAESPAIGIIAGLVARGAAVSYYDPLVPVLGLPSGQEIRTLRSPHGADFDIAVVHTLHPGVSYTWVAGCRQVLDATYEFGTAPHSAVV